jgi:hypothetical protein
VATYARLAHDETSTLRVNVRGAVLFDSTKLRTTQHDRCEIALAV